MYDYLIGVWRYQSLPWVATRRRGRALDYHFHPLPLCELLLDTRIANIKYHSSRTKRREEKKREEKRREEKRREEKRREEEK